MQHQLSGQFDSIPLEVVSLVLFVLPMQPAGVAHASAWCCRFDTTPNVFQGFDHLPISFVEACYHHPGTLARKIAVAFTHLGVWSLVPNILEHSHCCQSFSSCRMSSCHRLFLCLVAIKQAL